MRDKILVGRGREITSISRQEWERNLSEVPRQIKTKLNFMGKEHHLIRNFVVRELPYAGKPLTPEFIAEKLNFPIDRVNAILEELEMNLTFLFRNDQGAVLWAYPVTAAPTPHRITFNTGEQIYAA